MSEKSRNTLETQENIKKGATKKTYQAPLFSVLNVDEKAVSLKDNNEIIDYLINDVEEKDIKNYILYFLSKAEKKEIAWHKGKDCIKLLLEESKQWRNIYIDKFHNWKYNYSLLFENENDYNDMVYSNYREVTDTRVDELVSKIKRRKSISNITKEWK